MQTPSAVLGQAVLLYRNPDGTVGWARALQNGVKWEGANWLLSVGFLSTPQPAAIYGMLIAEVGYTDQDINDTHSSHPGWSEWTAIVDPTRPVWVPLPANGGQLGTLTPARFNISSTGQIRGFALTTISTLGSLAAGVLYNTAIARDPLDVEAGGTLDVSPAVRLRY